MIQIDLPMPRHCGECFANVTDINPRLEEYCKILLKLHDPNYKTGWGIKSNCPLKEV